MRIEECSPDDSRFFELPAKLYREDKNYVSFAIEEKKVVSLENPWLKGGHLKAFLCIDGGEVVGRISLAMRPHDKIARIGFLNSKELKYSVALIEHAEGEAHKWGASIVEGPVNFGSRERFWGCLVRADSLIPFAQNYHRKHESEAFLLRNFIEYYKGYVFYRSACFGVPEWALQLETQIRERYPLIHLREYDVSQKQKYIDDFVFIYNNAWKHFPEFEPITKDAVINVFNDIEDFIEPQTTYFIYDGEKPVGVCVIIKNIGEIFYEMTHSRGVLRKLIGTASLIFRLKTGSFKFKTLLGIVIGVIPEYRNKGIEVLFITQLHRRVYLTQKYTGLYFNWIGSFNPRFVKMLQRLGCVISHEYVIYRKGIVDGVIFEPHPPLL